MLNGRRRCARCWTVCQEASETSGARGRCPRGSQRLLRAFDDGSTATPTASSRCAFRRSKYATRSNTRQRYPLRGPVSRRILVASELAFGHADAWRTCLPITRSIDTLRYALSTQLAAQPNRLKVGGFTPWNDHQWLKLQSADASDYSYSARLCF